MKNKIFYIIVALLFVVSCKKSDNPEADVPDSEYANNCNEQTKDAHLANLTLKDLKSLIKEQPQIIHQKLNDRCFKVSKLSKNLYIQNIDRVDSLKIKKNNQGTMFLNKITAIEISQEIVYKLTYSFPIKFLNQYRTEIKKDTPKSKYHHSNATVTNEEFNVTYNVERFDAKRLEKTYSYQIDTFNGYARLTIFYSEDLPVN
ncbi:hypothetical protein [Chishuiella sp.]|uniref:hypothetical protein n=1 Tax=Chishuiella sp. TaxID=1969467 RepID=UPI0028A60FB2|nr:hypothetical protein [Chishuiella sp.]